MNIFTPGQPFIFDPSRAKDLGNGIYQIQTPDGKPVLYDMKGSNGPTVYSQDIPGTLQQYLLNVPRYLIFGNPSTSAGVNEFHQSIRDAWKYAISEPQRPVESKTLQTILNPTLKDSEIAKATSAALEQLALSYKASWLNQTAAQKFANDLRDLKNEIFK